jgi:hypothetical protein
MVISFLSKSISNQLSLVMSFNRWPVRINKKYAGSG